MPARELTPKAIYCGGAPLRGGKDIANDKDLVEYFQKVFKVREDFEASGSS